MSPGELSRELGHAYQSEPQGRKTTAIHLFGIRRADAIRACGASVSYIVAGAGIPTSYVTELHKGMALAPLVVERAAAAIRKPRCASCKFWRSSRESATYGTCHRRAPQAGVISDNFGYLRWPSTGGADWCGEYELQPP